MSLLNDRIQIPLSVLTDSERLLLSAIYEEARRRYRMTAECSKAPPNKLKFLREWPFHLTEREALVAELVYAGDTHKEIAKALKISPRTVETHSTRAREKLGAKSKAAMIRMIADMV
jgi:DNA-binding NarL/FixJ family response regulator